MTLESLFVNLTLLVEYCYAEAGHFCNCRIDINLHEYVKRNTKLFESVSPKHIVTESSVPNNIF